MTKKTIFNFMFWTLLYFVTAMSLSMNGHRAWADLTQCVWMLGMVAFCIFLYRGESLKREPVVWAVLSACTLMVLAYMTTIIIHWSTWK